MDKRLRIFIVNWDGTSDSKEIEVPYSFNLEQPATNYCAFSGDSWQDYQRADLIVVTELSTGLSATVKNRFGAISGVPDEPNIESVLEDLIAASEHVIELARPMKNRLTGWEDYKNYSELYYLSVSALQKAINNARTVLTSLKEMIQGL